MLLRVEGGGGGEVCISWLGLQGSTDRPTKWEGRAMAYFRTNSLSFALEFLPTFWRGRRPNARTWVATKSNKRLINSLACSYPRTLTYLFQRNGVNTLTPPSRSPSLLTPTMDDSTPIQPRLTSAMTTSDLPSPFAVHLQHCNFSQLIELWTNEGSLLCRSIFCA